MLINFSCVILAEKANEIVTIRHNGALSSETKEGEGREEFSVYKSNRLSQNAYSNSVIK